MKKLISVLIVFLMVFVGCKKNEDTTINDSNCRITKITSNSGGNVSVLYFEYDENQKLIRFTSSYGRVYTFNYNTEGYLEISTHNENAPDIAKSTFDRNGSIITRTISYQNDDGIWVDTDFKYKYELNPNGDVIREEYYHLDDDEIWHMVQYSTNEWSNGNMMKMEYWQSVNDNFELMHTITRQYDDMNNPSAPLKNTLLFDVTKNNVISGRITDSSGETNESTFTYEYNEKGYPSMITFTDLSGSSGQTISEYEYSCD